jgi:hypothetical protein
MIKKFIFFCVVLLCVFFLSSVLWCQLRFPHTYFICVCLRIVVLYFSSSCTLCCQFLWIVLFWLPFDILWRLFAPSHDVVSVHDSIYTCMIIEISSWIILCILAIFHFRVYNYIEHIIIYSSGKTEDYLRIWINISSSNLFPNRTNYFEFICIYIVKYCNSVLNWLINYV